MREALGPQARMQIMKKKLFLMFASLTLVGTLGSGCFLAVLGVGAGAGIGGYAYVKGELKSTQDASLDRAFDAAKDAMKDLEFIVTSDNKDALSAQLIAHDAHDKRIEINLTKKTETTTEIAVRVAVFGDEALSRLILDKIKSRLGKS